jgi:hypothetical protein
MTALCADEYLDIKFRSDPVWANPFEPQLTITERALQRWRRLDEGTHGFSFRSNAALCRVQHKKALNSS